MSVHQAESGTIQLPSDQATAVRHRFVARHNLISEKAWDAAKNIWDRATDEQRRDRRYLQDKLESTLTPRYNAWTYRQPEDSAAKVEALRRAEDLLGVGEDDYNSKPRAPQKKNLSVVGKTHTHFEGPYGSVTFDTKKNTLEWEADGNHGVEEAHAEWVWEAMHAELGKVRWTRGSGGVIDGYDEYRPEPRASAGFGPVGLKDAPEATQPFVKADGTRVTQLDVNDARAKKLRSQARHKNAEARAMRQQADTLQDRRRNGQFDFRRGSAPEVRLR